MDQSFHPEAELFVETFQKWGAPYTTEADPDFWRTAVSVLMRDAEFIIDEQPSGCDSFLQIGVCSHWLRPHQTRWTADGGFAWPSGYSGRGYSRTGLPEFDWNVPLYWHPKQRVWRPTKHARMPKKRRFVLRAALPARTTRHQQAVVNAIWIHGTPQKPLKKPMTIYGFRKQEETWDLTAWRECDGRIWK